MKASACILNTEIVIHGFIENILHLEAQRQPVVVRIISKSQRMQLLRGNNIGRIKSRFAPQSQEAPPLRLFRDNAEIILPDKSKEQVPV